MRKAIASLLISCIISGCIISSSCEFQKIIDTHTYEFVNTDSASMLNVAAILRTFVVKSRQNELAHWNDIENMKDDYFNFLSENPISSNYPIVATPSEIEYAKGFLNDTLHCLKNKKVSPEQAIGYVSEHSTNLLVEIMNYEE